MSKKRPITQDERHWWAILVDAEMFTAMHNHDKEEEGIDEEEKKWRRERSWFSARVAAEARHVLVTRFGANLDSLAPRAREAYDSLYTKFVELDREEKEKTAAVMKLLDEAKARS